MSICQAVTSAGRPCSCKARHGFTTCGRHKNTAIDPNMCGELKVDGSTCTKRRIEGDTMCKLHRTIANRREYARRVDILWRNALDLLWGPHPIQQVSQLTTMFDDAFDRGWITEVDHVELHLNIYDEWRFYRAQRLVPTSKATTDLERLALDKQNIHTKEVSQLTSDAMKFLLETSIPENQDTIGELEIAWSDKKSAQEKKVLRDVKVWYRTDSCIKENDWMYKRMLDGLWVRVKGNKELTQRLWEEMFESVDKCCQGHLSRLANVLVGFTEEVKPEVPVGQILQQKIAAISSKDIGVEWKVCEAWVVFEELHVPMVERDAWIEAL